MPSIHSTGHLGLSAYLSTQSHLPLALAVMLCLLSQQSYAQNVAIDEDEILLRQMQVADVVDQQQLQQLSAELATKDQQEQQLLEQIFATTQAQQTQQFEQTEFAQDPTTANLSTALPEQPIPDTLPSVEQVLATLESAPVVIVSEDKNAPTISTTGEELGVNTNKQQGWIGRLWSKVKPGDQFGFEEVPRISTEVQIVGQKQRGELSEKAYAAALENLKANVAAKLSTFPQESFNGSYDSSDSNTLDQQIRLQQAFELAQPQLRSMAKEAAQAVGFYQAQFRFQALAPDRVKVEIDPQQAVIVKSQQILIEGQGADLPAFDVLRVVPELDQGDVFHHGTYELTKAKINDAASNNGFFDARWHLHDVRIDIEDPGFEQKDVPQPTAAIHLKYDTADRYKMGQVNFRLNRDNNCYRDSWLQRILGQGRYQNNIALSQPDQACSTELPLDDDILAQLVPWDTTEDLSFAEKDSYTAWRVNLLAANLTNSRYFNYALVDAVRPDPLPSEMILPPDLQALVDQGLYKKTDFLAEPIQPQIELATADKIEQTQVDETVFAGANEGERTDSSSLSSRQKENEVLKNYARVEKTIPVIVTLNADELNSAEVGLGYGTDTGVRLRGQYRRAIVNRRGHAFDANLELSQIRQSVDTRYTIPYHHPLNDYLSVVAGYEREEREDVARSNSLIIDSAVVGIDRIIKNPRSSSWQHTFGARYRLDRLEEQGIVDPLSRPDQFQANGEQQSLLVGYEGSKVISNDRVNPTRGFKQTYKLEVGAQAALSDADMAIANAGWTVLYSLGENSDHQMIGRANLGYIFTDNFSKVPYNLRYFTGGDQTLRGFDYKSLAPEQNGYLVGGQGLAVGSVEYNYQFKPNWRAAIFSDFGNAYDRNWSNDTEYSLGVGVRWASPIGPIRIDVASGISDPGHPIRLHFFIGPIL